MIVQDYERWAIINRPESLTAQTTLLRIEVLKLKREVNKLFSPIIKFLSTLLNKNKN